MRITGWQTLITLGLLPVSSGCVSPMGGAPNAAGPAAPPPTSAQAGGQTIIAIAPPAAPALPPPNVFDFLGVPQMAKGVGTLCQHDFQKLQMLFPAQFGAYPGLEAKPPILPLTDPANLQSDNPAIKAAAEVKKDEDIQLQKIKAIKYLAGLGCRGCYPEVEKAILAGLDDCTEEVRFQVASGLRDAAGAPCKFCKSTSCCSPAVRKRLFEVAEGVDDEGCFLEPSARVRRMARVVMDQCGPPRPQRLPTEGPSGNLLTPASELDQSKKPDLPTSVDDPLSVPEGESIPLRLGDETAAKEGSTKTATTKLVSANSVNSSKSDRPGAIKTNPSTSNDIAKSKTPTVRDLKSKVAAHPSKIAEAKLAGTVAKSSDVASSDSRVLASVDGVRIYRSEIEQLLKEWTPNESSNSAAEQRRELQEFVNQEIERLIVLKKRNTAKGAIAQKRAPKSDSMVTTASFQDTNDQIRVPIPEPVSNATNEPSSLPDAPSPDTSSSPDVLMPEAPTLDASARDLLLPEALSPDSPQVLEIQRQRSVRSPAIVVTDVPNEVYENANLLIYGEPIEVNDELLCEYFEAHRECYLQRSEVRWEQVSADYRDFLSRDHACKSLAALRKKIISDTDETQQNDEEQFAIAPDAIGNPRKVPLNLKKLKAERFGWTEIARHQDPEVAQALLDMPVGNLSPIIEERGRFRVVRVLEVRNRRHANFEDVKEQVRNDYIQARVAELAKNPQQQPQHREWTLFAGDEYILSGNEPPPPDGVETPRPRRTTVFDSELVPDGSQTFEHITPKQQPTLAPEKAVDNSRDLYDSVKDRLEIHFGDRWSPVQPVKPRTPPQELPIVEPPAPATPDSQQGDSSK